MEIVLADLSHDSLKPLTYTRSVSDVEAGGSTIFEHVERELEYDDFSVLVPDYLEDVTRKNSELYGLDRSVNDLPDDDYLLHNPSVIPDPGTVEELEALEKGEGLFHDETFVAGITDHEIEYSELEDTVREFESIETDSDPMVLEYPWDLFQNNGELIERSFPGNRIGGEISDNAVVEGEDLYLGEDASIEHYSVVDTTEGPVYIGEDTDIRPNTRIKGPAYIGSGSEIGDAGETVIHPETHIGDVTNVSGEVKNSVIHSFSNKPHFGFLGRSVLGSWVNLGAGTTNSDLKNTYSTVEVEHPAEGTVEAGWKIGAIIGDHTKSAIGTDIYTGKNAGPVAMLLETVRDDVPPLTFMTPEHNDYRVEDAKKHAEQMMSRKENLLPDGYIDAEKQLIDDLDEKTGL